uniref:Uncharacterized protein n=1 Tax=Oryza brachyantha TaxID=4533 RepID=J3LXI2_ORYBR
MIGDVRSFLTVSPTSCSQLAVLRGIRQWSIRGLSEFPPGNIRGSSKLTYNRRLTLATNTDAAGGDQPEVVTSATGGKVFSGKWQVDEPDSLTIAPPSSAPSKCFAGSRFWTLGGISKSLDEEDEPTEPELDVESREGRDSDAVFLERAMAEGFTLDEVLRAGEHLLLAPKHIPRSCSKNKRVGRNGELARRIVDEVASQNDIRCKPWR